MDTENRKMPGLPPTKEQVPVRVGKEVRDFSDLWTLSYIRNNAIKFTILQITNPNWTVEQIVIKAKEYCRTRNVTFSWIEPTVKVIE